MRTKLKLVAVKLTPTETAAVEQLVRDGYYKTVSGAIRASLLLLFDQHKVKLETLCKIRIERVVHPMRRKKGYRDEV